MERVKGFFFFSSFIVLITERPAEAAGRQNERIKWCLKQTDGRKQVWFLKAIPEYLTVEDLPHNNNYYVGLSFWLS